MIYSILILIMAMFVGLRILAFTFNVDKFETPMKEKIFYFAVFVVLVLLSMFLKGIW